MNIAVLLGVSDYERVSKLPGCKNDIDLMRTLIESTGKFDEIIRFEIGVTAIEAKERMTALVKSHAGTNVEELFFYYTGHGEFDGDDFFYPLSDYDERRVNQTCIRNSELDNWFRSIDPKLMVKVIDACQSGVQYVKQDGSLKKVIEESKERFQKTYFMYSSMIDQSSYQSDQISAFTLSFVKAVLKHPSQDMRYRDIVDSVSDDFANEQKQTPFFVIQADYTELFATNCLDLSARIDIDHLSPEADASEHVQGEIPLSQKTQSLVQMVIKDSERFRSKEQVQQTMELVQREMESHRFSPEITDLFKMNFNLDVQEYRIPSKELIGKWLEDNAQEYFAKATYDERMVEEPFVLGVQTRRVKRKFITGYSQTASGLPIAIEIVAESKYPNLPSFWCLVANLYSRTEIRVFYSFASYGESDWGQRALSTDIKWFTKSNPLADEMGVNEMFDSVLSKYDEFIIARCKSLYKPVEE